MNDELRKRIKETPPLLQSYPLIKTVYLFGSYAREKERGDSDIDFALLVEGDRFKERGFLAYELERRLGFIAPVEIIILNHQNLLFKFQVIKEGKIIYEADRDLRVRFETGVMKEYHRLEPHLEFFERYRIQGVLKRLGIYETA
ncbi:MAG: nucleotidyltransferase domain-containing protein [Nitrospirae bacterium]|nr:nucleotidyltransferase domain-containing protein [Nitrospirota bacterium]